MRWGYAHTYGPFELWDALGFEETARRMESEGRTLPPSIVKMLASGAKSFYQSADANGSPKTQYFDLGTGTYADLEERPGVTVLADVKRARGVVKKNAGCSLIDLGDGVLCLEFHSKMNSLGEDQFSMMFGGVEEATKNFQALVVGNQGENFSVGANLVMALLTAQDEDWDLLNMGIHRFQQANMALKTSAVPVVVAAHGRALGGGCEIALHASKVQASAELYMGLVEVGVGLIPGGGGCKEMIVRLKDARKVFETIGYAKVSSSADDAKKLGLLDKGAGISMNQERLIADAKELALSMVNSYRSRGGATQRYQSGRQARLLTSEDGVMDRQTRRLHFRSRRVHRRKARQRSLRRPVERRITGQRTVLIGSGARSVPQPLRSSENARAHGPHAQDGQAAAQLGRNENARSGHC